MSIIRCKMCGGNLELTAGSTLAVCENCGRQQTVPSADDEKKLVLFERAERLRKQCEFDKAAGIYEAIVADFRQEAEGYWGLVLCKYGIEYVDDPTTGEKVPTCHRSSYDCVLDDADFEQTMENADPISRRVYREEAKQIELIRKRIVEVSGKEEPYDLFICYKETDMNNQRTVDSVLAQNIYTDLTAAGYRTFFARITLEDKLGAEYEPIIFAALNSAKVMLVVGTDYEHFNAVWVKNEWGRYLKLMAEDHSKHLIPCYKDIDPYDMPKEFRALQAQDLGKVGAMQDLLRGIEKIIPKTKQQTPLVTAQNTVSQTAPLLERAKMFLEDGQWQSVKEYCNRVLDIEPQNGTAYLYMLLEEFSCHNIHELRNVTQSIDLNPNYRKIMAFSNEETKKLVSDYNTQIINKIGQKNRQIQEATAKKKAVQDQIAAADSRIKQIQEQKTELVWNIERCKGTATAMSAIINELQRKLDQTKWDGKKKAATVIALIMLVPFFCFLVAAVMTFLSGEELNSIVGESSLLFQIAFSGLVLAPLFICFYNSISTADVIKLIFTALIVELVLYFIILVLVNNPFRMIEIVLFSIFPDEQTEYFQDKAVLPSLMILTALNYLVAIPSAFIHFNAAKHYKEDYAKLEKELGDAQRGYQQAVSGNNELAQLEKQLQENELLYLRVVEESRQKVQNLYNEFHAVAKLCGVDTTVTAPSWFKAEK